MIRDELRRKDQVRYLVSRVKSRDLSDMKRFLEILEKEAPDVVANIDKIFEENRKNNVKCKTCALCLCSSNVDIKDVSDMLWSSMVIPDGFYNEIIACTKPLGSQKHLWKTMIDILNGKHNKKNAYESLFSSILSRGNFDFIVKPLRVMLEKEGRLDCHCHSSLRMTSFELSIGSTSSHSPMTTPGSRLSAPSETEYTDDNLDATYRKRVARFERNSFIEGKHGENMVIFIFISSQCAIEFRQSDRGTNVNVCGTVIPEKRLNRKIHLLTQKQFCGYPGKLANSNMKPRLIL